MEPIGWFMLMLALLGLIGSVTYVLLYYADVKRVPIYATMSTWIGWFFAFCIVLLLPLDIATVRLPSCLFRRELLSSSNCETTDAHNGTSTDISNGAREPWVRIDCETLSGIWSFVYWSTYVLTWTAFPILQSYSYMGDFTPWEKFRSALKENVIFYVVVGVIGLVLLILVFSIGFTFEMIIALAIASATAWGLILLVLLLGYGLVEIPKRFWQRADREWVIRYYRYLAVERKEAVERARKELETTLKLVKKYAEQVGDRDPFRPYVDTIVKRCPGQYRDILYGEGTAEMSYSKLVALHAKVMSTEHEYYAARSLYINLLNRAFKTEDIMRSYSSTDHTIRWTFKTKRPDENLARVDWFLRVHIQPLAMRVMAVLCGILSICVIWSEMFLIFPKLSIFFQLLSIKTASFEAQWLFVFIPVTYITVCAYWSLFRVKLLKIYRLIPHQGSDANSLLFNAIYISRLIAPIAYNFLFMIDNSRTAFFQVMGPMKDAPGFLGTSFNKYFPIVLSLMCLGTLFNLYTRFIMTCCIDRFKKMVFDEELSEELIAQGADILAQEREQKERGAPLSIDILDRDPPPKLTPLDESEDEHEVTNKGNKFPDFSKIFSKGKDSNNNSPSTRDDSDSERIDSHAHSHNSVELMERGQYNGSRTTPSPSASKFTSTKSSTSSPKSASLPLSLFSSSSSKPGAAPYKPSAAAQSIKDRYKK